MARINGRWIFSSREAGSRVAAWSQWMQVRLSVKMIRRGRSCHLVRAAQIAESSPRLMVRVAFDPPGDTV